MANNHSSTSIEGSLTVEWTVRDADKYKHLNGQVLADSRRI